VVYVRETLHVREMGAPRLVNARSALLGVLGWLGASAAHAAGVDPYSPDKYGAAVPDPSTSAVVPAAANSPPGRRINRVRLALGAGASAIHFTGTRSLSSTFTPIFVASQAYRLDLGGTIAEFGLSEMYLPVPFRMLDGREASAFLAGAMARLGISYPLGRFEAGLSLEPGMLVFGGLHDGNPFTVDGAAATGPVPMPTVRAAFVFAFTPLDRFATFISPGVAMASTTSPGLTRSISTITRWEALIGVAYDL
jgi:hypothetical protein